MSDALPTSKCCNATAWIGLQSPVSYSCDNCGQDCEINDPMTPNKSDSVCDCIYGDGACDKHSDSGELREILEAHARFYAGNETGERMNTGAALEALTAHIQAVQKAYGGCHNCYGKGYASYQGGWKARGMRWSDDSMKFCDCERGQQLKERLAQYLEEKD